MRRLACLQALAVLLLAACSQGNEAPHRVPLLAQPVEVEFDDSGRPLDRQRGGGVPAAIVLRGGGEGVTAPAADGHTIAAAADDWDIIGDGLIYTFFIDHDGRWSNGEPLTAHHFVWAWQRAVGPGT